MDRIKEALDTLRTGNPVIVYDSDDREGEADMIYAAAHVDADAVTRMRNDAGGLICTALANSAADRLNVPYYRDIVDHPATEEETRDYGDKSSFALWVNHADTFTGITDTDRATTIQNLADAAADTDYDADDFAADFTTPGHVPVLRAAPELLHDRRGHTEIGVYLAQKAKQSPAAVVCEMLDDTTGDALSKDGAKAYAEEHGLVFLTGKQVLRDWKETFDKIGL